jgi:predicted amidophosphoribosyltransferase
MSKVRGLRLCPRCGEEFTTEVDDAPCCREHGRFGWFRRFWWLTGIPRLLAMV